MSGSYLIIKHCPKQPTNKCIKRECNHKIIDTIYMPFNFNKEEYTKYFNIKNFHCYTCSKIITPIEEAISNLNNDFELYPEYIYRNGEDIWRMFMKNFKNYLTNIFDLIIKYPEYTLISSNCNEIQNYNTVDKSTNTNYIEKKEKTTNTEIINEISTEIIQPEILYPKNLKTNKDKIEYMNKIIKKCYKEISFLEDDSWVDLKKEFMFIDEYYIDSEGDSL